MEEKEHSSRDFVLYRIQERLWVQTKLFEGLFALYLQHLAECPRQKRCIFLNE